MAVWRNILADPATGAEVGEVFQADQRNVTVGLNGLRTVTGSIALDNPMADVILGATTLDRINLLLKSYRLQRDGSWKRWFVGEFTDAEETDDAQGNGRLSYAAAGPFSIFAQRLLGKTPAGYGDGTPLVLKDLGTMAHNILAAINADGDTGVRVGTWQASTNSYVGPWYFKPASEAILQMGPGTLGGYDFDFAPVEPAVDGSGLHLADLNVYAALGSVKDNAAMEFGTGRRNVSAYSRKISAGGVANKAYSMPPGFPSAIAAGDSVLSSTDAASVAARRLREAVATADLGSAVLRQELLDETVRIRKQPREQITFTLAPNTVELGTDCDVGDLVPARAVVKGKVRFNAYFRLYGAAFAVDSMGNETLSVTLANDQ